MTRALEVESHDTATSSTMASRTDEPLDQIFSFRELARLDEALTLSSRETGLRFTLYVGDLGTPTRARAEELHAHYGGRTAEVDLVHCPFLPLARTHPEVVCAVHRGLMRGTLEVFGEDDVELSLTPFVEPHRCLAHMTTRTPFAPTRGART